MAHKNVKPDHEIVIKGLNLLCVHLKFPCNNDINSFTEEGYDGYVFAPIKNRDFSLYLLTEEKYSTGALDIRHWGYWERDPEADWDEEDDDWEVLSEESSEEMQTIIDKVAEGLKNIDPRLTIEWSTSEKNHIEIYITLK